MLCVRVIIGSCVSFFCNIKMETTFFYGFPYCVILYAIQTPSYRTRPIKVKLPTEPWIICLKTFIVGICNLENCPQCTHKSVRVSRG